MKYTFLAASLPELIWNTTCKLSSEEFEVLLQENLCAKDRAQLRASQDASSGFIALYAAFVKELNFRVAGLRSKFWHKPPPKGEIGSAVFDEGLVQQLESIYKGHAKDPLGLHQALLQFQFQWIENMETESLSFDSVASFYYKYLLLNQWLEISKKQPSPCSGVLWLDTALFSEA